MAHATIMAAVLAALLLTLPAVLSVRPTLRSCDFPSREAKIFPTPYKGFATAQTFEKRCTGCTHRSNNVHTRRYARCGLRVHLFSSFSSNTVANSDICPAQRVTPYLYATAQGHLYTCTNTYLPAETTVHRQHMVKTPTSVGVFRPIWNLRPYCLKSGHIASILQLSALHGGD